MSTAACRVGTSSSRERGGSSRGRACLAAVLALAVVVPLTRSAWFLFGSSTRLQQSFTDDAYYYALIAEHMAHGQGSTFGGLVPTNGYQPLWQWLLVPLALLADADAFLRLVYVLSVVLFSVSVVIMWLVAQRLGAGPAGICAIALSVTVGMLAGNQFFIGMEIAVVVPAILAFVWIVLTRPTDARTGLLVGVLGLVITLGRLDALAFPVFFLALMAASGRAGRRAAGIAAVVLAGGMGVYMLGNVVLFGTAVPISGLAKGVGGGRLGWSILIDYLIYGELGPLPMWLGAQAVVLTAVALVLLRRRAVFSERVDRVLRDLLLACLAGQVAQIAYYSATSSFPFWPWYYYYVPVQLFLAGLVIAQVVLRSRWVTERTTTALVAAAAAVGTGAALGSVLADDRGKHTWTDAAVPAARWVVTNSAPTDVVAIGDRAGYFTWLTRRPTVQLEGLVQDVGYLPYLENGQVAGYMMRSGVRYYVRSDDTSDGVEPPSYGTCTMVEEPVQGSGPRSWVRVCPHDLVYRVAGPDFIWSVWRCPP